MCGFVIGDPTSARGVLEPLLEVFGVHAFEQDGRFVFRSLARASPAVHVDEAMVLPGEGEALTITLEDKGDLPGQAQLFYQDPLRDYQAAAKTALREEGRGQGDETLSLSGMIEGGQAQALVETWLARRWSERRDVSFALPWSSASLHVGDRVRLPVADGERDYAVTSLNDGEVRHVKAVALAPAIRFPEHSTLPQPQPTGPSFDVKPVFHLLDLPLWPGAEQPDRQFRIACHAKPWRGVAVYASPQQDDFQERALVDARATMGELTTVLGVGASGRIMTGQTLDVLLYAGELQSRSPLQVFNGANTALLKAADGTWEVLQFIDAEEIAPNHWRLSRLLRGQIGTEAQASSVKPVETPFVLLDDAVVSCGLLASETGLPLNWRIGTAGRPFSDSYFDTVEAIGGVRALLPLAPVHLRAKRLGNDDISLRWVRRGRIDGDSWLGEDIPLGEERECYRISIMQNGRSIRQETVAETAWVYPRVQRIADLGSLTATFDISVAMISSRSGAGEAKCITFNA